MAQAVSSEQDQVLIKKYGNRRLYDTRQSRYITLEELAKIVKGGATIKVVDAGSGRDLSRQVLTQVILEQQERLDMIPVELLHALIRTQGTLEQAPFSAFLSSITRQFLTTGRFWAQQMNSLFAGLVPPVAQAENHTAPSGPGEDLGGLRERMDALLRKLSKDRQEDSD